MKCSVFTNFRSFRFSVFTLSCPSRLFFLDFLQFFVYFPSFYWCDTSSSATAFSASGGFGFGVKKSVIFLDADAIFHQLKSTPIKIDTNNKITRETKCSVTKIHVTDNITHRAYSEHDVNKPLIILNNT